MRLYRNGGPSKPTVRERIVTAATSLGLPLPPVESVPPPTEVAANVSRNDEIPLSEEEIEQAAEQAALERHKARRERERQVIVNDGDFFRRAAAQWGVSEDEARRRFENAKPAPPEPPLTEDEIEVIAQMAAHGSAKAIEKSTGFAARLRADAERAGLPPAVADSFRAQAQYIDEQAERDREHYSVPAIRARLEEQRKATARREAPAPRAKAKSPAPATTSPRRNRERRASAKRTSRSSSDSDDPSGSTAALAAAPRGAA